MKNALKLLLMGLLLFSVNLHSFVIINQTNKFLKLKVAEGEKTSAGDFKLLSPWQELYLSKDDSQKKDDSKQDIDSSKTITINSCNYLLVKIIEEGLFTTINTIHVLYKKDRTSKEMDITNKWGMYLKIEKGADGKEKIKAIILDPSVKADQEMIKKFTKSVIDKVINTVIGS